MDNQDTPARPSTKKIAAITLVIVACMIGGYALLTRGHVHTSSQYKYVGSVNSDKYHYQDCRWAQNIKPGNLITFTDEKDAQKQGYRPCKTCHPPR